MVAVARGGLANLAGAGFAGIAGLVVAWLVATRLTPAAAGVFFTAVATFTLAASVARLGTPTGLVYWVARFRAYGRPDLVNACLRAGTVPVALAATGLAVGLWLAAPWLAGVTGGATGPLRVLAAFLPAAALTDALLAATRGHHQLRPTVALEKILRPGLQLLGVAGLAVATLWTTVPLAAWPAAWALPYLPVLGLAGYAAYSLRVPATPAPLPIAGRFWRYTGPRAVASVLQQALQRLDILLVAALAGPVPAAIYAVAGRFVILGQFANQAVGQAVQSRLAERLGAGDTAGAAALYQTATGWLVLATWPLHLLVAGFATLYLGLFGDGYRTGAVAVVVLAAAMLLATACGMVDMLLVMAGRTGWNLLNVSLALGTMVAADLLLIPRHGALGAAIGLAAAVAVNNLLPLAQVGYALRIHPFGRGTLTAVALAAGWFGALPALVTSVAGTSPAVLAGTLAAATAGYAAGVRRLRHRLALAGFTALVRNRSARRPYAQ